MLGGQSQAKLIGNIDLSSDGVLEGWVALRDGSALLGSRRVQFVSDGRIVGGTVAKLVRTDIPGRGTRNDFGFRVKCLMERGNTSEQGTITIVDVETQIRLDTSFVFESSSSRVLLDVGDTLIYLTHHSTVSGIQRVVIELYLALVRGVGMDISIVAGHESGLGFYRVPNSDWDRLLDTLTVTPDAVPKLAAEIRADAFESERARIDPETVLLAFGSPWVSEEYIDSLIRARVAGARVVSLVYDLIPSRLPHMFDIPTKKRFERVMATFAECSDRVMSISEHTGREFEEFCREQGLPAHEPVSIRLASGLGEGMNWSASPDSSMGSRDPYVVLVSTIEGRKGHALALDVWERLVRTLGRERTPKLVFVGRPGWNSHATFDRLTSTKYVDGLVSMRTTVSDRQLVDLYKGALFSLYPSSYEGWGLPVGESLSFGTPVIAANNTSIPEVGGEAVRYFTTGNGDELYDVVTRWLEDEEELAAWVAKARRYRPDAWLEVAQRVNGVVAQVVDEGPGEELLRRPESALRLQGGEEVTFGFARTSNEATDLMALSWEIDVVNATSIMGYPHSTAREVRGSLILWGSMFPPEAQGRWSRLGSQLGLSFAIDPDLPWTLVLSTSSGDRSAAAFVRVSGDCRSASHWVDSNRLISLDLMPRRDGRVEIDIEVQRKGLVPDEDRPLGLFLRSALLISPSDVVAQSKLLMSMGRVAGYLDSLK